MAAPTPLPFVEAIQPYQPGKPIETLKRELGLTSIIKLASNENPLGCSPKIKEQCLLFSNFHRYPDPDCFTLKQALSQKYDTPPESITLGNGSNDILELIARAYCTKGDEVIFDEHAFCVYALATEAQGATKVVIPSLNWGHDLNGMFAAITAKTRIIYIANPNNPTGTLLSFSALSTFIEQVPKSVLIVIDEAYHEYVQDKSYHTVLKRLPHHSNLIVTRTFSKAYGLAGLRLGFAISHPTIAKILAKLRQPFSVNSMAQHAAEIALTDPHFISKTIALNQAGLNAMSSAFGALNLNFIPSSANFICVDFGKPAFPFYQALLHKGIIVRPLPNYHMPHHLRISTGTTVQNTQLIQTLTELLSVL